MPQTSTITYVTTPSPIGTLCIGLGEAGIVALSFDTDELAFCHDLERRGHRVHHDPAALRDMVRQIEQYFAGRRTTFDVQMDLSDLSPFRREALRAVHAVPYGEVRSYGEIAWAVGKPGAARAIGSAVATNPIGLIIPCHRIIRGDGSPGEYATRTMGARGVHYKLKLLALEGVRFGSSA